MPRRHTRSAPPIFQVLIYQHSHVDACPRSVEQITRPCRVLRETTIKAQKAIGASIIADRATWPELWTCLTFCCDSCGLASFNSLRTSTDRQLSTKPEARTSFTIDTMMSGIGIGDALLPTDRSYPRSSLIETLLRFLQSSLVFASIELDADCPYERLVHRRSIPEMYRQVKEKCAIAPIFSSPWLKPGVSENGGF